MKHVYHELHLVCVSLINLNKGKNVCNALYIDIIINTVSVL